MKKKIKKVKIFVFFSLIVLIVVLFYEYCIVPIITVACEEKVKLTTNNIVNVTAAKVLKDEDYDSLFITKNDQNDTNSLFYVNSKIINNIALKLCNEVQSCLFELENQAIFINLGTISGIVPLGNIGPDVKINVIPINSVCYEYVVGTQSVGINQVHYSIALKLKTTISLLIPGRPQRIDICSEVLIVDCVIAGNVPQVFAGGIKIYDLVPQV